MGDGEDEDKSSEPARVTLEEVQLRFAAIRQRIREIERKALARPRDPRR
jgi:DNA-directed RNA polymerase sigma subunit (sigma70/sigma32)